MRQVARMEYKRPRVVARPRNTAVAVAIIQQSQRVIIDQEKPAFDDVLISFFLADNLAKSRSYFPGASAQLFELEAQGKRTDHKKAP